MTSGRGKRSSPCRTRRPTPSPRTPQGPPTRRYELRQRLPPGRSGPHPDSLRLRRLQPIAQLLRLPGQTLQLTQPVRLVVARLLLTHVLLAVLQQAVHPFRDLPRRRHYCLAAPCTRLDPAVERTQRILRVMAALARQP